MCCEMQHGSDMAVIFECHQARTGLRSKPGGFDVELLDDSRQSGLSFLINANVMACQSEKRAREPV